MNAYIFSDNNNVQVIGRQLVQKYWLALLKSYKPHLLGIILYVYETLL